MLIRNILIGAIALVLIGAAAWMLGSGRFAMFYTDLSSTQAAPLAVKARPLPSPAYLALTAEQRIARLRENGTTEAVGDLAAGGVEIFTPILTVSGVPFNRDSLEGKRALDIAAYTYAVFSLDFEVSMQDLLDTGLWPFTPGNDLDLAAPVELRMDDVRSECLPMDYLAQLDSSSSYLLLARRSILMNYYKSFFFPDDGGPWIDANLTVMGGLDPMGMGGIPMMHLPGGGANQESSKRSEEDLPAPWPLFWSDADGKPLVYGNEAGNLIFTDANCYIGSALMTHGTIKQMYQPIPVVSIRAKPKPPPDGEMNIEELFELPPPAGTTP